MIQLFDIIVLLAALNAAVQDCRRQEVCGRWAVFLYLGQSCLHAVRSQSLVHPLLQLCKAGALYLLLLCLIVWAETRAGQFLLGGADLKAFAFLYCRYPFSQASLIIASACILAALGLLLTRLIRRFGRMRSEPAPYLCPLLPFILAAALLTESCLRTV